MKMSEQTKESGNAPSMGSTLQLATNLLPSLSRDLSWFLSEVFDANALPEFEL
jgi:hypothetical protein